MNVLRFLFVGVIAGWPAGVLVKGGGFGLIGDQAMKAEGEPSSCRPRRWGPAA
jgi:hypothetical protein